MEPSGQIIAHRKPLPFGEYYYEHEWQGGDVAAIHRIMLDADIKRGMAECHGNIITLGQFRLRIIEDRMLENDYFVMRDGWEARLYAAWYKAMRWWRWLKVRFILTLYVWGLAQHNEYDVVTWDDVYAVAKAKRWLGKLWAAMHGADDGD